MASSRGKPSRPQPAASCLPLCVDDDQKLLAQIIDYYCRTLKETTEGLGYLRSRGVTVGEAIGRFRIGYSNRTLGLKLPVKQLKASKQIRAKGATHKVADPEAATCRMACSPRIAGD